MATKTKGSTFKMRSGNSPLFKDMGSSPLLATTQGDAAVIAAATPQDAGATEIDYDIDKDAFVVPEQGDTECDAECRKKKRADARAAKAKDKGGDKK